MSAVEFQQVSKSYPVYASPAQRLKELLTFNRLRCHEDFWALRDINFDVQRGETFCLLGENGSGKSTLLQIVAGILRPTLGSAQISGRVAALLELGSGFNPEYTGRENVFLNGAILGLSHKEIGRRFRDIEEFAEIGKFLDQPVKTYSSGMVVRLAFAVAIHVDPEILLVDEALAVGDIYFRQRCLRKVHELRTKGVTILFVSHAVGDVKAIGDRVLWLDKGRQRELGPVDKVVAKYLAAMTEKDTAYLELQHQPDHLTNTAEPTAAPELETEIPNIDHRWGDRRAEVIGIRVYDAFGEPLALLEPSSRIVVRISIRANEYIAAPNIGFMLRNHLGMDFAGTNALREGYELPPLRGGEAMTIDFHIELPQLYPANFSFSPAVTDGNLVHLKVCDWIDNAVTLQMGHSEGQVYGYMHLPCRVEVNSRLRQTTAAVVSELSVG